MHHIKIILAGFIFLFSLSDCSEIFEKNIDNEIVVLLAPPDSFETTWITHTFWWQYVDGAAAYNLQIVNPSFEQPQRLLLDTNVNENQFTHSLFPGEFEWRVSAFNGSSATWYTVHSLSIDTSSSLNNQPVILKSPDDNAYINTPYVLLWWYKLGNAIDYRVDVKYDNWSSRQALPTTITTEDTVTVTLDEGVYAWGVQAQNESSSSLASHRIFTVDTTAPGIPNLLTPVNGDTLHEEPFVFTWEHSDESLAPVSDSIWIASDSTFSTLVASGFVTEMNYSASIEDKGIFYWKVRSIDATLNRSDFSIVRKFTINDEE